MLKTASLWKLQYSHWDKPIDEISGYTILLPVPGDLPVFLKIALEICSTQKPDGLVETLVIPDQFVPGFGELLTNWQDKYYHPIRLINPNPLEQLISRYQNNPHNNHWLQLVRGVNATRTKHALLHDADLFITEDTFMKTHYETCESENLACLGVSPVWDSWYKEQGLTHLTATWEMMLNVDWVRNFQPWQHRGHDGEIAGVLHTFDTTLFPQCQTKPDLIRYHQREWGFIHFNYVICTYRWFQKSKTPFEDECFRIVLIRLLIEAFDTDWKYQVPEIDELIKGITDSANPVTYIQPQTRQNYSQFRSKMQTLIESKLLDEEKVSILSDGAVKFDKVFGYSM
ncbi:hypothetical protein NIES4071_83960 [Calothrix sp. NIES-4071]|nr:hypothetical protein NIES4071_83960 [Calothrix sp. NIES-4071]BAZ62664.1 hypothetical protein NIES4105_83890 [Calothrix sp. NIES-4105]